MLRIIFVFLLISVGISSCSQEKESPILPGAYQIDQYLPLLKGKKVGFYGNHTSIIENTHTIDTLLALDINIVTVFSPEHGISGTAADGEIIELEAHNYNFELYSLYGKSKSPTEQQLQNVDVLLVDIQEVGVRFYTYSSTLTLLMDKCAEMDIPVIILDRPSPNGSYVDGPVLDSCCFSFVGMHPVPVVYGLTIGELARMINEEGWLPSKIKAELTIIPVLNWSHEQPYALPVRPSPNLPNDLAIALYPSLALFEGTRVSIGRGTEFQFQVIGHPKIDSSGFSFTPRPNLGSKYPKFNGERCYGESFIGTEPNYHFSLTPLITYYQLLHDKTEKHFFKPYIDQLIGNESFKEQVKAGWTEIEIRASWEPELSEFKKLRLQYLIYE